MKKKLLKILKIVVILAIIISILVFVVIKLTWKKFYSHEDFAEKIVDSINNHEMDKFYDDNVDVDGVMAYISYQKVNDEGVTFSELYDFMQELRNGSADVEKYSDLMEKLEITEEYINDFPNNIQNAKKIFKEVEEYFQNMKIEVTSISNEENEFENVYSCSIEYNIKTEDDKDLAKDKGATFYYLKSNKNYYLIYITLINDNSANQLLKKAQKASEETIISNMKEEISSAFSFSQTLFYYTEKLDNLELEFRDCCTLQRLEENMSNYKFCTADNAKKSPENKEVPLNDNETVYVTNQEEDSIYEVKLSISAESTLEIGEITKIK